MEAADQHAWRNSEFRQTQYAMATNSVGKNDGKSIQSVDRALSILEALSLSNSPLMLNEIAKLVGINLSTCHHLVKTLVKRGYVVYAGRSSGYSLSSRLEAVAQRSVRDYNLVEFVRPKLQELNIDLREAVQMAVLRGSALVTHIRLPSHIAPQLDLREYAKLHTVHAVAPGKAILAWLPEAELARVVADNGLASFTDKTITSLGALIEELRLVRRSGFAMDDGEFRPDLVGYGAVVRDMSGAVVCSVGATIPRKRASDAYRSHVARAVVDCARELSGRMPAGCFV
ncbi:transcriptional regulator, IclR family [Xaviernesmea oryzae]|uniref:Transcriptional regulator, IclR family n=2 Tax=Rhizobium/Agrobacterium group TaxID=227290 RepID=A0A1X7FTR1_9HYPH|nr:IclR family transcriptional regulator [Xaviernesmea oryzae]SMF58650.1 transcriptional regulator, IclR family [Xaviernesmea oryzae]